MKNIPHLLSVILLTLTLASCNVEDLEKYNEEFIGEWRTDIYYSPSKGDSIRNYFTVDGRDSGFGFGCEIDDPFVKCLTLQTGKLKYNKASRGLQVGNSVQFIHYVDREPFINDDGKWELMIDSVSYYKY